MRTSEKPITSSAAPAFSRVGQRHKRPAQTTANGIVASATSPRQVHGSAACEKYAATPTSVSAASASIAMAAYLACFGGRKGPVSVGTESGTGPPYFKIG